MIVAAALLSGAPARGSNAGLAAPQEKEIAMELVSSAENSTLDWRAEYAYIQDIHDGRGYTAGIIGFTSGTGDMLDLVTAYARVRPRSGLARFLPALRRVNGTASHAGLGTPFVRAWKQAAKDPVFQREQDRERDRVYFDPAVRRAKADGLGTLGQFIYYDAMVMHGPGMDPKSFGGIRAAAIARAPTPAQGGSEVDYLNTFLDVRRAVMKADPTWADSTDRIDTEQRVFLREGNLGLTPPLAWSTYGDHYRIGPTHAANAPTAPPLRAPALAHVRTWAFAIGTGDLAGDLDRYAPYGLVVVDGEEATAAQVARLRRQGSVVLAYLDVGTIEPGRSWYGRARRYRLGYWPDWQEWYADVSAAGYRALLTRRVAPMMLAKGFDGLFLDNVDMLETHPRQASGMVELVRALGSLVHHGRRRYLFTQNGADVLGPMLPSIDGWNREDVSFTYDFSTRRYARVAPTDAASARAELRRMRAHGLLTLATDYVAAGDSRDAAAATRNACAAGALSFVSDIELGRIPARPPACPASP